MEAFELGNFWWTTRRHITRFCIHHWLPTAAARVRARVWSCGICGGQSGAGVGFLRVLRFPLPIFIPPIAPQSPSSIIWGLYNRPEVAAVPSGLSPTPRPICCDSQISEHSPQSPQISSPVRTLHAVPIAKCVSISTLRYPHTSYTFIAGIYNNATVSAVC
jgi:hypothetical protein